jgi:hypothetical protein
MLVEMVAEQRASLSFVPRQPRTASAERRLGSGRRCFRPMGTMSVGSADRERGCPGSRG